MNRHKLSRRNFLKAASALTAGFTLSEIGLGGETFEVHAIDETARFALDQVFPNSVDPVLSAIQGREVRIPNTCAAINGQAHLHATPLVVTPLSNTQSILGHDITDTRDPLQGLELALNRLLITAQTQDTNMTDAAQEALDILVGETEGRIYDGFSLLNFNRGAYVSDHIAGEYKTKRLIDTGETVVSEIDGETHRIWEITINMLWYGQNFDSDTFLIRMPYEAHEFDEFRVNWRIYSLIQEDLAPTTITSDGFGRIFHGFDSTFESIPGDTLSEISIKYPSLRHFRGMYVWGWGSHPPRVQFIQPIVEINERGELNPVGQSFSYRTANDLTIENIGTAAPEKKAYLVATAALNGASKSEIVAMLTDSDTGPQGTFHEWLRLAADQRQLPPEAWEMLATEDGLTRGDFGDYDIVLAYMNNEIYGETPYAQLGADGKGCVVRDWDQSSIMRVKIINLDNHVHYYRNVDFGSQLTHEIETTFGNGKFSFEKFSPKPSYGVPKVAEMQWRTGWGYVPHIGIAAQSGVFPRASDHKNLVSFTDQLGKTHLGYVFQNTSGYWRFNPPAAIREGDTIKAGDPLRDSDGEDGVLISYDSEAFGIAKMPEETITMHPNQEKFTELNFPGFLRNPTNGGDIIPATPVWAPFLILNPITGTLYDRDERYWVDSTYFHGRPLDPNTAIVANIEAPRSGAQLFYQFDPLFHDNMIFSLHPRADIVR